MKPFKKKMWAVMNKKTATEIFNRLSGDELRFNSPNYMQANGWLDCYRQMEPVIEAVKKHVECFEKFKDKQFKLLVEGQDLETASKNWEEAAAFDDGLDFSDLQKALEHWKKEVEG